MNAIRHLRKSHGLSQQVVALACGVTADTVGRWERSVQHVIPRHQRKLAKTLGVTIADLQLEDPVH